MNSPSKRNVASSKIATGDLDAELKGVKGFLWELRHNRGRWKMKWVKGMIHHYEEREAKLKGEISRRKRRVKPSA